MEDIYTSKQFNQIQKLIKKNQVTPKEKQMIRVDS